MFFTSPKKKQDSGENELTSLTEDEEMTLEEKARMFDQQIKAADRLSIRLMNTSSADDEDRVLRESLNLSRHGRSKVKREPSSDKAKMRMCSMVVLTILFLGGLAGLVLLGVRAVGPPNQPVGPYRLLERHEGMQFFDFYTFYEGRDSLGSNGFNTYIGEARALVLGVVNVTMEKDILDLYTKDRRYLKSKNESEVATNITDEEITEKIAEHENKASNETTVQEEIDMINSNPDLKKKPFVYMSSASTADGPRESIRLEGKRRFNHGLFIIDLRHMPAGCGVWPAFWLTDEANWPINGEIDIVEGVNYQSVAKTALHTTKECKMDDIPQGLKTGGWDEAVGIPDKKTGIPDMTLRYATDCFVYNPHQWLNQGCVAVDEEGRSLGVPLNRKGGGVFVLEWDPAFRHIRTWVFSPHTRVPENLQKTISTASSINPVDRVRPDPDLWPLPYGYFAVGENTDCPSGHFKNMRLVFNLAFCGSVAGNRFQMDCPIQAKKFKTCNDWLRSDPDELKEAYWKIRGVYVYEREWERAWS